MFSYTIFWSRLDTTDCQIYSISLICSREVLIRRLQKDVDDKIREEDVIAHSLEKISLYERLETVKVDVSHISPEQTAELIIEM